MQLIIDIKDLNTIALMKDWQWLLDGPHEVLVVTAMGDAFVANQADEVLFLDTLEGRLTRVASSREAFFSLMNSGGADPLWFNGDMVAVKVGQGCQLQPGECYSYMVPPAVGGSFESDNVEATDALVHFSVAGQIHRQIKSFPDGTRISKFVVVDDGGNEVEEANEPDEAVVEQLQDGESARGRFRKWFKRQLLR